VTDLPRSGDIVRDLNWFNSLPTAEAIDELLKCCSSNRWANQLEDERPFTTIEELSRAAHAAWQSLSALDWLQAFRSHPRIGEQQAANEISQQAQAWSQQEQSAVHSSAQSTVAELSRLNEEYQEKFGYIFIVCASGKSPEEIIGILKKRIRNEKSTELKIAATEHEKITELRLRKLLGSGA
jgi:OHCU decarboxylase